MNKKFKIIGVTPKDKNHILGAEVEAPNGVMVGQRAFLKGKTNTGRIFEMTTSPVTKVNGQGDYLIIQTKNTMYVLKDYFDE